MTSSSRTIYATIPIGLYDRLRAAADRNDRPMSWIIRQALKDYLDESEDVIRQHSNDPPKTRKPYAMKTSRESGAAGA